jgi:putative hydrolase of the HAD superfamily
LFDIGDTLWHAENAPPPAVFRRLAAERASALLAEWGIAVRFPDSLARAAWDAIEAAMASARHSGLREPDYAMVAREALQLAGLALDRERAATFLDRIYVSGEEGGKALHHGVIETLRELRRRGFLLAVVTNRAFGGTRFRQDMAAAGLDIDWDAVAISCEVGFLKPHPAPFQHALGALGVEPEEALMVGNSLAEDIRGAQGIGMRAAWRRSAPDAEGVTPDIVFGELCELLQLPDLREAAR